MSNSPHRFNLLLGAYCFFLALFFGVLPVQDIDVWWEIASGHHVLAYHSVPTTDPFSFTALGNVWVHHEWAAGVLYALLWQYFGFFGLAFYCCVLLAAVLFVCGRMIVALLDRTEIPYLSLLILAYLLVPRLQPRPHMLSLLFFSILVLHLVNWMKKGPAVSQLFYLVPLFIVWANFHGAVIIGVALLFLSLIALFLRDRHSQNFASTKIMGLIFLSCLAATMINPYGLHILTFPFEHLAMGQIIKLTDEWKPTYALPHRLFLFDQIFMGFWFLSLVLLLKRKNRFDYKTSLVLPLAYLSMRYNRYTDIFLVVMLPFFTSFVNEQFQAVRATLAKTQLLRLLAGVTVPVVFLLVGIPATVSGGKIYTGLGLHPHVNFFKSIKFIQEQDLADKRIMNTLDSGGFLAMVGIPVYIDARSPVYGDEFIQKYATTLSDKNVFWAEIERWKIELVLARTGSHWESFLKENSSWKAAHQDDNAVIFLRQ